MFFAFNMTYHIISTAYKCLAEAAVKSWNCFDKFTTWQEKRTMRFKLFTQICQSLLSYLYKTEIAPFCKVRQVWHIGRYVNCKRVKVYKALLKKGNHDCGNVWLSDFNYYTLYWFYFIFSLVLADWEDISNTQDRVLPHFKHL